MITLLLGPHENKKDPTRTGGIVVLYENLLSWIKQNTENKMLSWKYVDTNKENYSTKLIAYILILLKTAISIPRVDVVMLNGTANDYLLIAPFIVMLSKIFRKKVVLRKFAGNFNEVYENSLTVSKNVLDYVLRNSDLLYWETKYLVEFGKRFNTNNYWLPNIRFGNSVGNMNKEYNRSFCFISHVTSEKGVLDIISAAKLLDNSYKIDIFGPLLSDLTENDIVGDNVSYCGALTSDEVVRKLSEYSCLLLPSRRKREGYPGIIIEGYSVGLPVIATNIGGIPEIVDDGETGFLIQPGDSVALANAIKNIDADFYKNASNSALKKFDEFNADIVYPKILSQVMAL